MILAWKLTVINWRYSSVHRQYEGIKKTLKNICMMCYKHLLTMSLYRTYESHILNYLEQWASQLGSWASICSTSCSQITVLLTDLSPSSCWCNIFFVWIFQAENKASLPASQLLASLRNGEYNKVSSAHVSSVHLDCVLHFSWLNVNINRNTS